MAMQDKIGLSLIKYILNPSIMSCIQWLSTDKCIWTVIQMALVGLGCPPWDRKAGKDKVIIARLLDSVGHKGGCTC